MRLTILTVGLVASALTASAAMAELRRDGGPSFFRDSDGDVISVFYDKDGNPFYMTTYYRGGVIYTLNLTGGPGDDILLDFGAEADNGALPPTVDVAGNTLTVERSGNNIILRDMTTGERFQAKRTQIAAAPGVNPKRFALE